MKLQPFLYRFAKASEFARDLVNETTAVFRSNGLASFCVSGRIMLRYIGVNRLGSC